MIDGSFQLGRNLDKFRTLHLLLHRMNLNPLLHDDLYTVSYSVEGVNWSKQFEVVLHFLLLYQVEERRDLQRSIWNELDEVE